MSWADYRAGRNGQDPGRIRRTANPYEINVIGYLWTARIPATLQPARRWYQIRPRVTTNGAIFATTTGSTSVGRETSNLVGQLDEPNPGDVVLVRSGTREGRGIGIVYRNDYSEHVTSERPDTCAVGEQEAGTLGRLT